MIKYEEAIEAAAKAAEKVPGPYLITRTDSKQVARAVLDAALEVLCNEHDLTVVIGNAVEDESKTIPYDSFAAQAVIAHIKGESS